MQDVRTYSKQLREEYPNTELAECGHCHRQFPDVFPSARCPFEYWHKTRERRRIHDCFFTGATRK